MEHQGLATVLSKVMLIFISFLFALFFMQDGFG